LLKVPRIRISSKESSITQRAKREDFRLGPLDLEFIGSLEIGLSENQKILSLLLGKQ